MQVYTMIRPYVQAIPVSYLSLLIASKEFAVLIQYLGSPALVRINNSDEALSFKKDASKMLCLLSDEPELCHMFQLKVITDLLLSETAPDQVMDIVSICCPDYPRLFPQTPIEILSAGTWLSIPVIGMHQKNACLRNWIIGLVPGVHSNRSWPPWADNVMDPSARKAASDAGTAVRLHEKMPDVFFTGYPLVIPNNHIQVSGGSLGLALALGYYRLMHGNASCCKMIASGAIAPTGEVLLVEDMRHKADLAAKAGYQVFIYPAACGRLKNPEGLELAPVGTLEEAVMFLQLYSPGKMANLILFQQMLKDPDLFISACSRIDRHWLKWAKTHCHDDSLITSLIKIPEQASRLVERLANLVSCNRLQDAICLSEFVGPRVVQDMMTRSPASAFKWAVVNLAISNHLGQTESAASWAALAEQMIADSAVQDISDYATYVNIHFIQLHHNHYVFRPELPGFVVKMLAIIEKQHQLLCENGFSVNRTLAAFYGSIAQNYAFCGPAYLFKVKEYVRLAQEAFGGGLLSELNEDWRRQFNYLTYACLDAGDFQQAEAVLMRYLNIESRSDIWKHLDHFSSWQHALLSRFITDIQDKNLVAGYLKWSQTRFHAAHDPHHPWQLWLLHLGRMSQSIGDHPTAREYYRQCVDHCLSGACGPTVQVMALMPLAYWRQLPGADLDRIAVYADQALAAAENLSQDHFHLLATSRDALSAVAENVAALFPFSYR
jgi:hypothetical protein